MATGNDLFHKLTRNKLDCGKNLIELTTYNSLTLWWFVDSNFHNYVDNLQIGATNRKSSRLKFRLIFFYKKIEMFLDFLLMVTIKLILNLYGKSHRPRLKKKNPRIIFTALNIEWRMVNDYENLSIRKSDALFDSVIKTIESQCEMIGTSALDISIVKSVKIFFEKLTGWYTPHKPLNLYWSINVWKKEREASKHFDKIWNIVKDDKIFRESCKYGGKDFYFLLRSKLHLYFYYWLPLAVKYIEMAIEMVINENPDLFLIQDEIGGFGRPLIIAGKLMGVPTLAVQHGEITPFDYGYIYPKDIEKTVILADQTCVFGQHYYDLLTKQSIYDPEQVIITGSLRSDMLYQTGKIYTKGQLLGRFSIKSNYKIVLWTTQCHGISEEENVKNFNAVFKSLQNFKDVTLIIKQHPGEEKKYTKLIESHLKQHKVNAIMTPKKSDTYVQINLCDLLITRHSTTAMEAVALNKPVIILNLSEDQDIIEYVKEGVALGVYRDLDLSSTIQKLLDGKDELSENREKYIENFLYKIDGKAAKRVVDVIIEIIYQKA